MRVSYQNPCYCLGWHDPEGPKIKTQRKGVVNRRVVRVNRVVGV